MTGRAMRLPEEVITGGAELESKGTVLQCMQDLVNRLHALKGQSITIGRHELTPYRDVFIVKADDLERTDDDERIHRYVQKGLARIPHLRADWEGLKKEVTRIDHLWNKRMTDTLAMN
ncbi:hypothetical protein scyTo_0000799 [Scyliorhinus torazame]|uniref:Uncharacterized protein n=1 Tax=Scyliorhinus torazame TaxID=75743 RepID=A0A401P4D0_SCYTO|nr:hypothetical protein [Scyliorhinus torazame]